MTKAAYQRVSWLFQRVRVHCHGGQHGSRHGSSCWEFVAWSISRRQRELIGNCSSSDPAPPMRPNPLSFPNSSTKWDQALKYLNLGGPLSFKAPDCADLSYPEQHGHIPCLFRIQSWVVKNTEDWSRKWHSSSKSALRNLSSVVFLPWELLKYDVCDIILTYSKNTVNSLLC